MMSDMDLGMTERLKPIHERVAPHGARRDHAARRGIPGRGRQEAATAGSYTQRQTEILEGLKAKAQGARPVEFLADRLRAAATA